MRNEVAEIGSRPIHLGLCATAAVEPEFTGDVSWYASYEDRHAADGVEGRLVTMHIFTESWDMWEMHPMGSEGVLCVTGRITVHQEHADGTTSIASLEAGQYVINEPGTWHTADVETTATALFITAGVRHSASPPIGPVVRRLRRPLAQLRMRPPGRVDVLGQ